MVDRLLNPLKTSSFFLFGARGTGKTFWLKEHFSANNSYYIDLLDEDQFDKISRDSKFLSRLSATEKHEWIIIDEIQRRPELLNQVHKLIEENKQKFILTGSSARKLKRGGANLLGGRANLYNLFPFTSYELKDDFDLSSALHYGTLPRVWNFKEEDEKRAALKAYVSTYLKEEILVEQLVRKLDPFKNFLEIAAQMSGKIINASSIARDVGVDTVTVQNYYSILEETLIGFFLPAYHRSIRKSQREMPKFYLFDNGTKKALERSLDSKPVRSTSQFGELFEALVIQEIYRANHYFDLDYRLSYYGTTTGSEVDVVLSKGQKIILIEIKSTENKNSVEIGKLRRIGEAFGAKAEMYYLSQDQLDEEIDGVHAMYWRRFLDQMNSRNN